MQILNNIINGNLTLNKNEITEKSNTNTNCANITELPSNQYVNNSALNVNIPVSYTKINEISVPGAQTKASVFKLSNGQKIVIFPKKGPTVIKTTFNVGSLNETDDIRGISHFIEHNLFNGSKNLPPKEYDKIVSLLGGSTNASTGYNTTDYYINLQLLHDESLEKALMANAMLTQFPSFQIDQLQKEKEPVKSEIDMYNDNISNICINKVLKNLFGIKSNSPDIILGTKDNINSFDREKVLDYYNTWYTPDNAVTVITGDVDVNETINLVCKYYNKKNDYSQINKRHYEPLNYIDKPIREDINYNSPYSVVTLGFAIPDNISERDKAAIKFLNSFISDENSTLNKTLKKYGLNSEFSLEKMLNQKNSPSAFYTSISLPEEQCEKVLQILYDYINSIANNSTDINEFYNFKSKYTTLIENIGNYDNASINQYLTNVSRYEQYNNINETLNYIKSFTPTDIAAAAKKFLDLNKASICVAHSNTSSKNSAGANNKTNNTVSFGRSDIFKDINNITSQIQEYKLPNNIETTIVPAPSNSKSCINIMLETDLMKDVSQSELYILSRMLLTGKFPNSDLTYENYLNSNDIDLELNSDNLGLNINGQFYDNKFSDTLSLIKYILVNPNFSRENFEEIKRNYKQNLETSKKTAIDKITPALFPDIKSLNSIEQELKEIDNITFDDIVKLYQRIIANSQCSAILTANVKEKPYLRDMFNNMLSQGMPYFKNFIPNKIINTSVYSPNMEPKTFTAAEDNFQAEINTAYSYKTNYNVEDFVKINLLETILGGSMSSRLFKDLREKEKLAYSVHTNTLYQNDTGVLMLTILTTTDSDIKGQETPENINKALSKFKENVDLLKTQPVSNEELEMAKNIYKTNILNMLYDNEFLTDIIQKSKNSSYGKNYLQTVYETIDKITPQDILNTANYVFKNPPVTSVVASQKTLDSIKL